MDIKIGNISFSVKTLRSLTKAKAIQNFANFDRKIIEKAWNEANPKKVRKKPPKKTID